MATLELSPAIPLIKGKAEASKVKVSESLGWPWQIPLESLPFPLRHLVMALDSPKDNPKWVAIFAAVMLAGGATLSIVTWDRSDRVYFHHNSEAVPTRTAVLVNRAANIQGGRVSGSVNSRP